MFDWQPNKGNDHWWPRALQKYWCNANGQIFVTSPMSGTEPRSRSNKKIGMRRGWHHLDFGDSPWTHSFEREFGPIDNEITGVIDWIYENIHPASSSFGQVLPSWLTQSLSLKNDVKLLPHPLEAKLLDLVLSLLIRSPAFKDLHRKQPTLWGLPEDERIGTAEIKRYYDLSRSILKRSMPSGFYLFLHSHAGKFIYGDGLMDNVSASLIGMSLRGHCIVPLTPHFCLFFTTSIQGSYSRRVSCISASSRVLSEINEITNIYSSKILFSNHADINVSIKSPADGRYIIDSHRTILIDSFLWGTYFR